MASSREEGEALRVTKNVKELLIKRFIELGGKVHE